MEFFLELFLTAVVALLISFLVAKLVASVLPGTTSDGGSGSENFHVSTGLSSAQVEKAEIGVGDVLFSEEVRFGLKMDAPVLESETNFGVVGENVEHVDRFGCEADPRDELEEVASGDGKICDQSDEMEVPSVEAESTAAVALLSVIAKEMIGREQDAQSDSAEERSGEIDADRGELMVQAAKTDSIVTVSPENMVTEEIIIRGEEERSEPTEGAITRVENEESGNAVVAEDVRVEECDTVKESENKIEWNTGEESETMEEKGSKEKEELVIEDDDDDWEGIERSDLEKAFAAAANFLEESSESEGIDAEAKMELYGLHKIATEGSCREAQPMAVMVSARAKWNAWQKLGNMNQEEAMEKYLAIISKEFPGWMNNAASTGEKMPEMETSVVLAPDSRSLEDATPSIGLAANKNVSGNGESSG